MSRIVPSSVSQQDINITLWTTPDRIDNFDWALQSAAAILPNYEALFGYPYFLPKLDILALPDFLFQAMENWVSPTHPASFCLLSDRSVRKVCGFLASSRTRWTLSGEDLTEFTPEGTGLA